MPAILATEAKRTFGSVLDAVSEGNAYTVYRHNKPVARIIPFERPANEGQRGALSAYADAGKRSQEATAFARAMEAKHAAH